MLLSILAVIVIGGLAMTISAITGITSVAESSNIITIELKESLTITDEVEVKIPHPLVGTIQYSVDGEACYEVQEKIGVLYYRLMEECPSGF